MSEYDRLKAQKDAITRREHWRGVLALVKFLREANDEQLMQVAEFAAKLMLAPSERSEG